MVLLTFTIVGSELVQVPPAGPLERFTLKPAQTTVPPLTADIAGSGLTVTTAVVELTIPKWSVPIMV